MNSDAITINRLTEENKAKDAYIRELLDDLELARDPDIRMVTREMIAEVCSLINSERGADKIIIEEIFGGDENGQ